MPSWPQDLHLVGSIPLGNTEEVFRSVCASLRPWIRRLPDGETGERAHWISWQRAVFERHPHFERLAVPPPEHPSHFCVGLKHGVRSSDLAFADLGYARAALQSYRTFCELQAGGVIPAGCRFQVSLPTPLAPISLYVAPSDRSHAEPAYEARMLRELELIAGSIPHDALSVQWDTAVEFAHLEGVWPAHFTDTDAAIAARLVRLGDSVPPEVELGFHLCYGDSAHQHFTEPSDTRILGRMIRTLLDRVERRVQWIHLPVPRNRTDPGYYAALSTLHLSRTTLYLGLVHATDGLSGALARIEAARNHVVEFGIATECGFGRRAPATIPSLLRLHADILRHRPS